jgi:hypothetical protein
MDPLLPQSLAAPSALSYEFDLYMFLLIVSCLLAHSELVVGSEGLVKVRLSFVSGILDKKKRKCHGTGEMPAPR